MCPLKGCVKYTFMTSVPGFLCDSRLGENMRKKNILLWRELLQLNTAVLQLSTCTHFSVKIDSENKNLDATFFT